MAATSDVLSVAEEKAFREYLEAKWAASVTPASFQPCSKELEERWLTISGDDANEELPEQPIWRASDPLPTEAELVQPRDLAALLEEPSFWEIPKGPVEPRVKPYLPPYTWEQFQQLTNDERTNEIQKHASSLVHPQGEVMAAMKNHIYLNAPIWLGGRHWSARREEHRLLYNMSRYPAAENWFGDGFRLGRSARAVDHVFSPNSFYYFWNNQFWSYRLVGHVAVGVALGLSLSLFIKTFVSSGPASTQNAEWEEATKARYAKYNPDPISKHSIGARVVATSPLAVADDE